MYDDVFLEKPNDVRKKRQRLDLSAHEVDENFPVESGRIAMNLRRLKSDCGHDEWNKVGYLLVNELLVNLIHEDNNDGQLLENF